MNPIYVKIENTQIAFYESRNDGIPVVLVHGNSGSAKVWEAVFSSTLANDYRLIAFDFPGHGESDWFSSADQYTFKNLGDVIIGLLKHLGIQRAIFVGHSMGGHFLLQAVDYLPEINGILILNTSPIGSIETLTNAYNINEDVALIFQENHTEIEMERLVNVITHHPNNELRDYIKSLIKGTDGKVRAGLGKDIPNLAHEIEIISNLKIPIGILTSANDFVVNYNYLTKNIEKELLWRNDVIVGSNSGHYFPIEDSESLVSQLESFIKDHLNTPTISI